jgi:hypothetical protein
MLPNTEQMKSLVRWALTWASGVAGGYLGAKGWLTADQLSQVAGFFSSETVVTLIVAAGAAVWGLLAHTQANAVAVVAEMPGTVVSPNGNEIKVVDPTLAVAAAKAATTSLGEKK